ncbi:DEAD/DEAH box helicase [Dysgonomonas mossii]|uniref:Uncharacterized protein n=1 Tax=Dysgonomonas mossii DSM 22836 TaxID=742767 RepID=F8X3Y5_9BACT|nr:DEAD/DEAH box helicase [Dysgonomonas mossii]EGK05274.1 hypothetical protein HMPREF9456_02944 [Dysgonomonas mossii DSM 22836]
MHNNIDLIIKSLEDNQHAINISVAESFKYAQLANNLISKYDENGYRLVINILNNWDKIPTETIELWTDIIEVAGFYPYLEKNKESIILKNLSGTIRKELHLSEYIPQKYFHDKQFELLELLDSDKNVIVSAPTSFGKSLLIEEVVASAKYNNIVVIQPTLALLDETRRKLQKYRDKYKLIIRTSQEPSTIKKNIYLFTAERVNEYKFFPKIDFLVIDEFYKLSGLRDDERSASLNNAFYHILEKFSPKFYLLGPNIDKISDGFSKKYNAIFYKSNYSLVDTREFNIYKDYDGKFGASGKKKEFKERTLFDLLLSLNDEQTIIYCSAPPKVRSLANKFTTYLIEKSISPVKVNYSLVEWIEENISTKWSLIQNLQYGIGIHDGALQKHITTSIIDYFNEGLIKYLFCTSTIIEGVNTSAKNIIYFDDKKGPNDVDYFDYSNIKGRAGRMMEHYIGKIYNFNPPPKKEDIIIDIPFYQQNPIKDEVLIQLSESHVLNKNTNQFLEIQKIPLREKEVIKLNGLSVNGQKNILSILRKEISQNYGLLSWTNFPTYKQLEYVLSLAWNNLILDGETTRPMTANRLTYMTFNYGIERSINSIINDTFKYDKKNNKNASKTDYDILNEAIQKIFQIMKHWFQYKVPKWLSVMTSLQEIVCIDNQLKPGNYLVYANTLENDFIPENLTILLEYGIPTSAIRKLERYIPREIGQDEVLAYIKAKSLQESDKLLMYEKEKFSINL